LREWLRMGKLFSRSCHHHHLSLLHFLPPSPPPPKT
jgi:hypothetical protein